MRLGTLATATVIVCLAVTAQALATLPKPPITDDSCPTGGYTNTITDNDNGNVIDGTSGNDRIFANGGDDTVDGKGGDDVIYGGDGRDEIQGGNGTDTVKGGPGGDTIAGDWIRNNGSGDPTYPDDCLNGQDGADIVVGDKIARGGGVGSYSSPWDVILGGLTTIRSSATTRHRGTRRRLTATGLLVPPASTR
jgi:Ca2+-binding RTX toxin-like protein